MSTHNICFNGDIRKIIDVKLKTPPKQQQSKLGFPGFFIVIAITSHKNSHMYKKKKKN